MPSSSVIRRDYVAQTLSSVLLRQRDFLPQHLGTRRFDGEQDLLIEVEGEVFVQRLGSAAVDDVGDLRCVVRSERKAFAGVVDLTKSEKQFLAQRLAKEAVGDVGFETLVIDIHRMNDSTSFASAPYAARTRRPSSAIFGSRPRPRKNLPYALLKARARSAFSQCVSTRTVGSDFGFCTTVTRSSIQPAPASPTRKRQWNSPRCSTVSACGSGDLSSNAAAGAAVPARRAKYSAGCKTSRVERGGFSSMRSTIFQPPRRYPSTTSVNPSEYGNFSDSAK